MVPTPPRDPTRERMPTLGILARQTGQQSQFNDMKRKLRTNSDANDLSLNATFIIPSSVYVAARVFHVLSCTGSF